MTSLCGLLPQPTPSIHIVDVGAMALAGRVPVYEPLLSTGCARVTGFEPAEEECAKLNAAAGPNHKFLPYAVGDGALKTFRQCNFSMTSSLYEPNTALLDRFQNLGEFVRVVARSPLRTRRIDDLPEVWQTDYLKLDAQGAELEILEGAKAVLASTLVVHTEVEFVPLYLDQPLFAEVDQSLRRSGFCFHRFAGIAGRAFKPLMVGEDSNRMLSQALWADAIYVRDWMHWDALEPPALLKLALILHDVYSSFDLAMMALTEFDRIAGSALSSRYVAHLNHKLTGRTS